MQVKLANQDISAYVDEYSIDISDTLGQGPGVQGGGTGRAATCKFVTSLGPVGGALGAGQTITGPSLVRMGEVKIYDAPGGNLIYAGYAGSLVDKTERTRCYTEISAYDYWQHLDRIIVNTTYNGSGDVDIIKDLLNRYAGWVDRSLLPGTNNMYFGPRIFRNVTLQKAIQKIVDAVGWSVWIGYDKKIHYYDPTTAPVSSFSFSTSPNFTTTFDLEVTDYEIDDHSAINRVTCFGGRHLSNDITQDLSSYATGGNTIFQFPYYPHAASDGKYHVKINNGADLAFGYAGGSGAANTLKPTGSCDVLLNQSARAMTFATAPAKGATVTFKYRYEIPLIVTLIDKASYAFYGTYLDGTISDETILETSVAINRCKVLLLEQSQGLTTLKFTTRKSGLYAGELVTIVHGVRGINNAFMVQEVHPVPLGGGQFKYEISCGAWSWNLTDILTHLAQTATKTDTNETESTTATNANQFNELVKITATGTLTNRAPSGTYYARSASVGDGHDSYPGFTTITS